MTTVLYVLLALLLLSLLVVLHELGHFVMGRLLGFTIVEFSVGLGPKLFGIKGKKTEFTLRLLPIGGSCRFYGEDQEVQDDRCFNAHKAWQRLLVIVAGPLMNILTALVLSFVMLLAFGQTIGYGDADQILISKVEKGSSAHIAGVEANDVPLSVDGQAFDSMGAFSAAIKAADPDGLELVVLRGATLTERDVYDDASRTTTTYLAFTGGEQVTLHVANLRASGATENRLGIEMSGYYSSYTVQHYNVLTAAGGSFGYCWGMVKLVYESLWKLVSGQACISDMAGIGGTVQIMSEAMESTTSFAATMEVIIYLCALISVNLGVVNLLPIPALDGGRLVFILFELIFRKRVPPEKEGIVHFVGMVLLLLLMLALTVSDLLRCIRG